MAKIGFTKFGLKPNNEIINIQFNEQTIEVKQYLPIEEKLEIIANVLELSHDQNNFSNPIKVKVYTTLEIIEKYTNINFTEKQKENPTKLYDLICGSEFYNLIFNNIPMSEQEEILAGIEKTIESVYKHQNSILGILDTISKDYSDLNFDATEFQKSLGNPENLALLKDILTKLG